MQQQDQRHEYFTMLWFEILPENDDVRAMYHADKMRFRKEHQFDGSVTNKEFAVRECQKLLAAFTATSNKKYYHAYQLLNTMMNRVRE